MPQNQLEQTLLSRVRELLNPGPDIQPNKLPPPPGASLPEPLVVGSSHLAKKAHELFNIAPEMKRHVKTITQAPNKGVHNIYGMLNSVMKDNTLDPATAINSRLMGHADAGEVFVSPAYPDEYSSTLAHEFSHLRGHKHPASYFEEDKNKPSVPIELERIMRQLAMARKK